jgi:glutathione S-transferase
MRTLYHLPICPFSRAIRIALGEKKLTHERVIEYPWEERDSFIALNPAGELPVLVEPSNRVVVSPGPIVEYLEESYHDGVSLLPGNPYDRAEIRRMIVWMNQKFYGEVTERITYEKVLKPLLKKGGLDTKILRGALTSLSHHLAYLTWILEERDFMGGKDYSFADMAAAAHLSVLDFLDVMPWDKYPLIKDWYACLKSRPSFRPLLTDTFQGVRVPEHYINLDF